MKNSLKRWLKRLLYLTCCLLAIAALLRFAPGLGMRLFGNGNTQWISERFTETLLEKNELIVYQIETTGQETILQDAWLIGTVQKVILPYAFEMSFSVDLSQITIQANENIVKLWIPRPAAGYQKLTVDEEKIQKVDWLYPLTTERYAEMVTQTEAKLFAEYAANTAYQQAAWDIAVHDLQQLFQLVVQQSTWGQTCDIQILPLPEGSLAD